MVKDIKYNPNPISKLIITLFLSFSLLSETGDIYSGLIVLFIAVFFVLNKRLETALKAILFYGATLLILKNVSRLDYDFVKNYILTFAVIIKLFFLPLFAGKFLIATSDASSVIVSFEKMRFPKAIVIPIAVMFRYFPAFQDDKKHIGLAMKMRGITFGNPIKYLEYVSVPILISATNIIDDISKAAETRCIADPCPKTRYHEFKFGLADIIYVIGIITLNILGRLYA